MLTQTLYDQDFAQWIEQTIQQLEQGKFSDLDVNNLIEELKDLGKSEKKAFRSNLMILLAHLLKLTVQFQVSETMKMSWYNSVSEHRKRILVDLKETPSLKSYLMTAIEQAYPDGRDLAIRESKFAAFGIQIPDENNYPLICPFTLEEILDEDFYG
jgi:hypothetical protein